MPTNGFPIRSIKLILISIVRKRDLISEFLRENLEHSCPQFGSIDNDAGDRLDAAYFKFTEFDVLD